MTVSNDKEVIEEIAKKEKLQVNSVSSLAGGSINQVYLLNSSSKKMVVKINDRHKFPGMFAAEKEGLEELRERQTFDAPEVLGIGETGAAAYLLLEYKEERSQKRHFWSSFARQLAALHKNSRDTFGFKTDNYIGSLPQFNNPRETASDFYILERLEPQVAMASKRGFSFGNLDRFYHNISEEIPNEPPALIHGDLWNGNFITNEMGLPCLIDPAVSYAPREMDLAMMKLFGGFPEKVFAEYNEIFPQENGFNERLPVWQLYYLLVHLNIFGSSYLPKVKRIFNRFS